MIIIYFFIYYYPNKENMYDCFLSKPFFYFQFFFLLCYFINNYLCSVKKIKKKENKVGLLF